MKKDKVPQTKEEVIEHFNEIGNTNNNQAWAEAMIGFFEVRMLQGDDVMRAYENALLAALGRPNLPAAEDSLDNKKGSFEMSKIIVNIHPDFLGTNDEQYITKYQKRVVEILSAGWDVIEFENVIAQKSWRYETDGEISGVVAAWTQEALERAYQEAEA